MDFVPVKEEEVGKISTGLSVCLELVFIAGVPQSTLCRYHSAGEFLK